MTKPQTMKIDLPYDPALPLPGTYEKELKQGFGERVVHSCYSCSQLVEATQMSIYRWMDK